MGHREAAQIVHIASLNSSRYFGFSKNWVLILVRFRVRAARKPPREKHRDGLLVVAVPFAELGDKVSLLEVRAGDNPEGPKTIEKQAIQTYVRGRPDENKHEKVERVADPEIWAAKDEVWGSQLLAA
jgi:hypothetical protein